MPDLSKMDPEDVEQFKENRDEFIENAWQTYAVRLKVNADDGLNVEGTLNNIVDFYRDFRSEIEEML